jgi:hypothetical protein
MSKKLIAVSLAFALAVLALFLVYNSEPMRETRLVTSLVERNLDARGGAEAWAAVSSLRLKGQMDLGQDMVVPYVLDQKRPGKMCLEFVFDGETSVQCTDGKTGWKIAPFRGRLKPEPMTEAELRETADSSDLFGLLYNHAARGIAIDVVGQEVVDGRNTVKLQLTLPRGGVRWLYLDAETALEVKLEAVRTIARKEQRVETFYYDWQPVDGLLISRHQETLTEGDPVRHSLTVEEVTVNPPIDDTRFAMPASRANAGGVSG